MDLDGIRYLGNIQSNFHYVKDYEQSPVDIFLLVAMMVICDVFNHSTRCGILSLLEFRILFGHSLSEQLLKKVVSLGARLHVYLALLR